MPRPRKRFPRLRDTSLEGVKAFQDEFKESVNPSTMLADLKAQATGSPKYWWIFGETFRGKTVVWGPYYDAQEADGGLSKLRDGEIFDQLNTVDVTKATRLIKALLVKRGEAPDSALRRMSHKREE